VAQAPIGSRVTPTPEVGPLAVRHPYEARNAATSSNAARI
jgi:hypothetical protein